MQVPDMHWRLLEQRGVQGEGTSQDEPSDAASGQLSVAKIFVLY